jgi:hypothetical protein
VGGRENGCGYFPVGPPGTAALLLYLTDWEVLLRLAVATAGTAAWPRAGRWRGTRPGSVSRDSANRLRRTRFGALRGTGRLTAGAQSLATHICPVCGKRHEVHPVLHQLANGRQLTCSCRCKAAHRRKILAKHLHGVERAKRGMAVAECDEAGCYASAAGRLEA